MDQQVATVFAASKRGLNNDRILSLALGKEVKFDWTSGNLDLWGVAGP